MIDLNKLALVFEGYKKYFPEHCKDELYKWEAVKHFQDHWNIDAENFGEMFKEATAKTYNLLASGYAYPRAMILEFANADGEATRSMFRALYDEKRDLAERVDGFIAASENMRQKYGAESWNSHYQGINSISTYLWLRYPDKYYIYKYEIFRAVAKELSSDFTPRRTGSADNLVHGFRMYNEICEAVKADPAIREMISKELTSNCYTDPSMITATMDIGFYLTRFYLAEKKKLSDDGRDEWWPAHSEYDPGFSVEDWVNLISDKEIFTETSLQIMKRFKDYGGQATCKQLAIKYGYDFNYYRNGSINLSRRVVNKTGCNVITNSSENISWWPVLFVGKPAENNEGVFVWKLRDELSEALDRIDLSNVSLYADNTPAIWKISHGDISQQNKAVFEQRTTTGSQKEDMNASEVDSGTSFGSVKTKTTTLKHAETSQVPYDLIGKIAEGTVLTRRTVAAILSGIREDKFYMFRNNPEEFISKVIRLIKEQKATMIVEHIAYNQIEGGFDSAIFTAEKISQPVDKAFKAKKAIQDYVFTDGYAVNGQSTETKFALDLDAAEEVVVYAKLPKGFAIPTPVGNYSPDWAIAFKEGSVKHIYFIAETKGSMSSLQLKPIEQAKIECAKQLFNEISTSNVRYHDVDSYQSLLAIMNGMR